MTGAFGTSAPIYADLAALAELALAALLGVGALLAWRGRIRAHMICQSSIILVNLPIVLAWMVPQYFRFVLPGLPGEFLEPFYLVPTIMLVAGALAEALGIYILLVAGTNWVPERWRFRRYKAWMRTELALWWSVVGLGLTTYVVWYASGPVSS